MHKNNNLTSFITKKMFIPTSKYKEKNTDNQKGKVKSAGPT